MTTSFTVNKADLEFILKQIKISEATSIGYTPAVAPVSIQQAIMEAYGLSASNAALAPYGLRTVDGSFNSLVAGQDKFGAADTLFPRLTDPVYRNEGDETAFNGVTNTNYGVGGNVVDSDPRIISNLIVDMSVNNPAAIAAYLGNPLSLAQFEADHPGMNPVAPGGVVNANDLAITNTDLQTIPNQSPDIGLSPGFNAWMTFFGQFFDHGLDLVTKGSNGTVYVPLQADDPLIAGADHVLGTPDDLPLQMRFMALTRATPTMVDPDGAGPLPAVPQHQNTTTSFVDQNQTYTSHPSHQVFLREYVKVDLAGDGLGPVAVSTGRLIDGTTATGSLDKAIGNWADVKAQALTMLGIRLDDFDVHNVPLLLTDQYGKFIPGANGYAQMVMAPDLTHETIWVQEGTVAGITTAGSIGTNHAFLNDIAHHAAPGFLDANHDGIQNNGELDQVADSDPGVGDDGLANTYDDEMLNAHFTTGDGRGNENIALTTVHSIFHSEHNRLVDVNKATILASGDVAFLNEWLLVDQATDLTATQVAALNPVDLAWDGERLFQAARFGTEMQYQHLVFEEFARRMQPMVDPFIFNNSPNIDPSIVAEFAHTVYRFGHSMLTGTVDRLENDLTAINEGSLTNPDQKTLLAVFLNPQAYIGSGATLEQVNANIIRGLSRDVGNALDEFIVTDVRSNLLGLPLDLAVLNLARGRETGIPSLNETRAQLYNDTGLADLKPYASWIDFAENIKNAASVVNFIAAYGTHASILAATTLAGKRAAAENLVFDTTGDPADRQAFVNGTGIYASDLGGLNDVDLWIGGLAEKINEFGGMLGATFNFVFEAQMESLQFGDRMYYLTRTQGLNFLNQLEPNSFADLVMRNTELGGNYSTHLNGALFVTPDYILELDPGIAQEDYAAGAGKDPLWAVGEPHSIFASKVTRIVGIDTSNANGNVAGDGHYEGGTLKFLGGEHVVLGGTEGNDTLLSDRGIDTIWGDGGDDYINAGMESDDVFGGEGDDIIEDPFGDDVLRGNQGNDVITSARGADLLFGDQGTDFILLGQDASEAFGGLDGDFILGGAGKDFLLGNEGDDWIEGGAGFDTIAGDNSELFFNSPIIGHDVLFGQGDETDYDAESGDDIMASGPSVFRYEGMFGFDWGIGKMDVAGVNFDLQIPIFTTTPNDVLRDRFDQVEALSGWTWDDHLDGDDRGHKGGGSSAPDSVPTQLFTDHVLTQEGIDRIAGFNAWFGGARQTLFGSVPGADTTSFRDGNILMGGDGNDFLRGRGGYDILDGDAWLNVRIKIVIPDGPNAGTYSAESMSTDTTVAGQYAGKVYNSNPDGSPNFSSPAFGGASLTSLMLAGTINPGELSIVREIPDGTVAVGETDIDTAIFQGTLAEYSIEGRISGVVNDGGTFSNDATLWRKAFDVNGDGFISVQDRDTGAIGATIIGPDGQPLTLGSRGALTDDLDLLKNIEQLRFADKTIAIGGNNALATGTVSINDLQNKDVNPADVSTTFDLDGNPATPALVTPYVGQVLTATLSGVADTDGLTLVGGKPTGLTFQWQTTETGSNAGWTTIQTSDTYTVRSVDPGHILRAVAVFQDNTGTTETIASAATDGATAAFRVNENSPINTVVASSIPFNPDYDPGQTPGGPTDGDIVVLTHVLADNAGGRFKLVTVGGVQQIQVANGALLDYESDNEHQIVINSYIDAASAAALDPAGLIASRQFTVLLNNVEPEIVNSPATGAPVINDVTPTEGDAITASTLGIVDANGKPGTFNYQWQYSENGGTTWNNTGTNSASFTPNDARVNDILRVIVSYTDLQGFAEVVTSAASGPVGDSQTGGLLNNTLAGTPWDDKLTAAFGNDTLNGNNGDDVLTGSNPVVVFGLPVGGNDTLNGGAGFDILSGLGGKDALTGGTDADTFVFASPAAAGNGAGTGSGTRDVITDFVKGVDKIDLSAIDANTGAAGTQSFTFIGTAAFSAPGQIRYVQQGGTTTIVEGNITGNGVAEFQIQLTGLHNLDASDFGRVLVGKAGGENLTGTAGSDLVTSQSTTERDFVDGGTGGAGPVDTSVDTYQLNGVDGAEVFRIYTRAAALSGPNAIIGLTAAQLNVNTEIVITRTTGGAVTAASIIAELDNIEEINVNTLGVTANNSNGGLDGGSTGGPPNGDMVQIIGDFGTATNPTTSLNFNTITIDGTSGNDTIDISALTSAHRIVFKSNGGNDTIVGNLRPQDVIDLPAGATAAEYTTTTDANGVSTMTDGTHSITFTAACGMPQVGNDDGEDDDDTASNDDDDDCDDDDCNDDTAGNNDDEATSPTAGAVRAGTPQPDVLIGTAGDDNIVAFAGDDVATGDAGADTISAGEGADFISGGDGRDVIFAGAGDDQVFGGGQADVIYGDAGADRIFGEAGNDLITAGAGDDAVFGGAGDDLIVAELGDGNDVYFGDDSDGGAGVDTLDMSAATASVTVNLGSGPLSNGIATSSQTGHDTIWGIENVNTGSGHDTITASNAANVMNGGAGNDTYKFTSASAADGDTILGFEPGDRVDLTAIDANLGAAGDQSFTLVTGAAFTAAGQLSATYETGADGDFTVVQGNTGGNNDADFTIEIAGHHNLTNANLGL